MHLQHILTKIKKSLISEEGNILVLSVYVIILVLVLSFGMIEVGKVMVTKEKLQTAADAASLEAASMEAYREVTIKVHTERAGKWYPPKDEDDTGHCVSCGKVTRGPFTGSEEKLLEQGQWRTRCARSCPDNCAGPYRCWYEIVGRTMMYDGNYVDSEMTNAQVNDAIRQNAEYLYQDLVWAVPENQEHYIRTMVQRKPSLTELRSWLNNRDLWLNKYLEFSGYKRNCDYNCSKYAHYTRDYSNCLDDVDRCQNKRSAMRGFYNSYKDKLLKMINEQIDADNQFREWNNQRINPSNTLKTLLVTKNSPIFNANTPVEGNKVQESSFARQAEITSIKAYDYDRNKGRMQSPYYPSVVVVATATISNWFYNSNNSLLSVGPEEWVIKVCSQSSSSYRDAGVLAGQEYDDASQHKGIGSWYRIPEDACKYWEQHRRLP